MFLPSELETRGTEVELEDLLLAIVDPHFVRQRLALLAALESACSASAHEAPSSDPISSSEIRQLVTHPPSDQPAFAAQLRSVLDRATDLGALHDETWCSAQPAKPWADALSEIRSKVGDSAAARSGLGSRLADLLRAMTQELGDLLGSALEILRETYVFPIPREAYFGESASPARTPIGKTLVPVRFAWDAMDGAAEYQVQVYRAGDKGDLKELASLRVSECVLELDQIAGAEWRPGAYVYRVSPLPETGASTALHWFDVPAEAAVASLTEARGFITRRGLGKLSQSRLWGAVLEAHEHWSEAAEVYREVYGISEDPCIAARIARCYERLELDGRAADWMKRVPEEPPL